jgi:hypothetical protein
MITPALDGEELFGLEKECATENCAPPRSGLVQLWFSPSSSGTSVCRLEINGSY